MKVLSIPLASLAVISASSEPLGGSKTNNESAVLPEWVVDDSSIDWSLWADVKFYSDDPSEYSLIPYQTFEREALVGEPSPFDPMIDTSVEDTLSTFKDVADVIGGIAGAFGPKGEAVASLLSIVGPIANLVTNGLAYYGTEDDFEVVPESQQLANLFVEGFDHILESISSIERQLNSVAAEVISALQQHIDQSQAEVFYNDLKIKRNAVIDGYREYTSSLNGGNKGDIRTFLRACHSETGNPQLLFWNYYGNACKDCVRKGVDRQQLTYFVNDYANYAERFLNEAGRGGMSPHEVALREFQKFENMTLGGMAETMFLYAICPLEVQPATHNENLKAMNNAMTDAIAKMEEVKKDLLHLPVTLQVNLETTNPVFTSRHGDRRIATIQIERVPIHDEAKLDGDITIARQMIDGTLCFIYVDSILYWAFQGHSFVFFPKDQSLTDQQLRECLLSDNHAGSSFWVIDYDLRRETPSTDPPTNPTCWEKGIFCNIGHGISKPGPNPNINCEDCCEDECGYKYYLEEGTDLGICGCRPRTRRLRGGGDA